jgi:hypothetical protein
MDDSVIRRTAERVATVVAEASAQEVPDRHRLIDLIVRTLEVQRAIEGDIENGDFDLCVTPWAMQRLKLLAMVSSSPQDQIEACRAIVACECMIARVEAP